MRLTTTEIKDKIRLDHVKSKIVILSFFLKNEIERRRRQANNGSSPSNVNKTSNSTKNVVRADPKPFKALPAGMLKNDQHDQVSRVTDFIFACCLPAGFYLHS